MIDVFVCLRSKYPQSQLTRCYSIYDLNLGVPQRRTLVVKTHFPFKVKGYAKFNRAILLVRNPADVFLAYYNWQRSGDKTGRATLQDFACQNATQWHNFVATSAQSWVEFHYYWIQALANRSPKALLLVRYEDLQNDTAMTLKMMLKFLGGERDLSEENLNCILSQKEGPYHRPKGNKGFDPYALEGGPAMKQKVDKIADAMYSILGESGEK